MAGPRRRPEEVRQRGKSGAGRSSGEQSSREPDRVHDGRREPGAGQPLRLPVEEGEIEARVVRDEDGIPGEREEAPDRHGRGRSTAKLLVAQARERADERSDRHPRIDERLELLRELQLPDSHRSDLADTGSPGSKARGLEIDDDVRCALEWKLGAERSFEADAVAAPRDARVFFHDVFQQRTGEAEWSRAKSEQPSRRLLRRHRSAPLLDQLDEPVGGVQPKLHRSSIGEHTFARKCLFKPFAAP